MRPAAAAALLLRRCRAAAPQQQLRGCSAAAAGGAPPPGALDERLLELLVCPLSKTPLRHDAARGLLVNDELGVAWPIVDGVPHLPQRMRRRAMLRAAPAGGQASAARLRVRAPLAGGGSRPAPPRAGVPCRARRGRRSLTGEDVELELEAAGPALSAEDKARQRVLKDVLRKINDKHGQGTVMQMTDGAIDVERTPSGCLTLDRATGGGYPKGRIVEIFGPESSGKTTLALHAIAEVQRAGGVACFIDAEHAFDSAYAKRLGIDVESLLVCQPDHGEMAFNVMDELVRSGVVGLVVVDSVSALVPRSELEGDIGTPQIGSQARLMSVALRKIAANAAKSGCTIMFINQLRFKVGVLFGNPETTSGGNALKYYASMRLDIRAKEKINEAGRPEPVGNKVKVKVVKNKVSPPFDTAEFDIMYGDGINALGCVFDVAKELEVLEARGSHYYFEGAKLAQGRENVLVHLKDNPDTAARVKTAVKARLAEAVAARGAAARAGGAGAAGLSGDDGDEGFDDVDFDDDEALMRDLEKAADAAGGGL
ncbi:recA [Scenedesmus sp. PABB004]|nr:recA [Scenedesmus sp. PABB004]